MKQERSMESFKVAEEVAEDKVRRLRGKKNGKVRIWLK